MDPLSSYTFDEYLLCSLAVIPVVSFHHVKWGSRNLGIQIFLQQKGKGGPIKYRSAPMKCHVCDLLAEYVETENRISPMGYKDMYME